MLALFGAIVYTIVLFLSGGIVRGSILYSFALAFSIASAHFFLAIIAFQHKNKNRYVSIGIYALAFIEFLFVSILFVDGLTYYVFGHHFYYSYLTLFINTTFFSIIEAKYVLLAIVVLILCSVYVWSLSYLRKYVERTWGIYLAVASIVCLAGAWSTGYIGVTSHEDLFENIQQELVLSDMKKREGQDYITQVAGAGHTGNVILVFVESFSLADSKGAGGMYDILPVFDEIANKGINFTNFMSNGCTSDAAHVATLFGAWPRSAKVFPGGHYETFSSDFIGLGTFFSQLDYATYFVSTASLDFQNQEQFITRAGFEYIIGEEAFEDEKKYAFASAPDEILYDEILELVKKGSSGKQPYFVAAQTISTHLPYDTPYGKTTEEAWKYANDTLANFYAGLEEEGFFDSGTLVLVSDHRKFDEMTTQEREQRGQGAYGKIVGTIVGDDIQHRVVDDVVQHTDIYHILTQRYGVGVLPIFTYTNNPLSSDPQVLGRDRAIRYCKFLDNKLHAVTDDEQFYVTDRPDHASFLFAASEFSNNPDNTNLENGFARVTDTVNIDDTMPTIQLVGHRGGVTNGQNTMKGIRAVAESGIDHIEIDVAMTKDGEVFLTNGHTNNMTCRAGGKIAYISSTRLLKNCRTLDDEPLQTVEEVLGKIAGLFDRVFLELKVENGQDSELFVKKVVSAIRATQTQDIVTMVSYDASARGLASTYTDIDVGRDSYTSADAFAMGDTVYDYFLTEKSSYTAEQIAYVHSLGKKFVVYTLETKEELLEAIEVGVDMVLVNDIPQFQMWLDDI